MKPIEPASTETETPVEQALTVSDDEIAKAFKQLLNDARDEDKTTRDEYLRVWTRLEYYWNNILDIFQDPLSGEWRVPNWDEMEDEVPPRLINIYRPHGEAIVAALSVTVPGVYFHPDDADNPDDVEASKAYRNIVELLQLHNESPLSFIRCLVILLNQGTVFGYNYYQTDPKFGHTKKPKVELKDITFNEAYCPQCGAPLDAGVNLQPVYQCQECGFEGPPESNEVTESLPQIVGFDQTPKGSICQEIFSGLQVKIPAYAKKQEECGYILLEFIQAVPMLRNIFEEKADKISPNRVNNTEEGFAKIPLQYAGQFPENAANVSCLWVRPWQFWQLGSNDTAKLLVTTLKSKYPSGCYAIFINDDFIEAYEENMDEHWTISKNPMGSHLLARPLGENLATVQDIRAELIELELQTVEHGIPETFADPKVLDFNQYGKTRSRPGMVTEAKAQPGKSLADAFHTTKTAILSQEVDPIRQHIDQDAQFVLGSFPSVYGGPAQGGSKTAAEYAQSRSMALQRLGTTWKILSHFWAQFQARSAVEYASVLKASQQDERFTKREGNDSVNVWIRATALSGSVGRVEPESADQLPQSWQQKKDVITQLMTLANEQINMVLTHPRNSGVMKDATGLTELYIPGEEDRTRQIREFNIMSQGVPVPINPFLDNDEIHIETLKGLLLGSQGDQLSEEGKNACMIHLQEHIMSVQAKQQEEMMMQAQMQQQNKPLPTRKEENV